MTLNRNRLGFCLLALVTGTISTNAFGEGRPGFHKPGEADKPVGAASTSASATPKKHTLAELCTTAMPTTAKWDDHFEHVTDGGVYLSKGLGQVNAIAVFDGKPLIAASLPGETTQNLVYKDKLCPLTSSFYGKVEHIIIVGTRVFVISGSYYPAYYGGLQRSVYDSESGSSTSISAPGRGSFDSAGFMSLNYGLTLPPSKPYVPTTPTVEEGVTAIIHKTTVRNYILANGKPLLAHPESDGQRVWWGEDETHSFKEVSNLVFQGGKVSFTGTTRESDSRLTSVVAYDGGESEALQNLDLYAVTDAGLPLWVGPDAKGTYAYGEGTKTIARYAKMGVATYTNGHAYFAAQDKQ